MTQSIYQITYRAPGGAAGSPPTLKTAQIAYNGQDGLFYVGFGDDGSGNATSIKTFASHDFSLAKLLPAGGGVGQLLAKSSNSDYAASWIAPPLNYTGGTGITITGASVAVDNSIATVVALTNGLATKAALAHTHDASDIVSGTLDVARIPNHDASKVTSGVFDVARIPVLPSQVVQVASGDLTTLTTGQQNAIAAGTVVTTSDGYRWVYTGSGSKTVAGNYTQLADITPDWSAISSKPVFATVSTTGSYLDLSNKPTISTAGASGSYTDLTNKPTISTAGASGSYTDLINKPALGTMAPQNANAIAVTGGTMSGVTLSGCTISGGTF